MPKTPSPAERIAQAGEQDAAAKADIAAASAKRLAELLERPPAERLAGFEERYLTNEDRAKLRRSLTASMPRRGSNPVRGFWRAPKLEGTIGRALMSPLTILFTLTGASWLAMALWSTPSTVQLGQRGMSMFTTPDGRAVPVALPAGTLLPVVGTRDDQVLVRLWVERVGYATGSVPRSAVQPTP